MYRIEFTRPALKDLRALPASLVATLRTKLEAVAAEPYGAHPNVKRLSGSTGYRLRVGDWRVLYELEDDRLLVLVVRVAARGQAYKRR